MASPNEFCCGYCLSEGEDMVEPKILSCGHIFCLSCLILDIEKSKNLKCIICRVEHKNLDVKQLKAWTYETEGLHCNLCRRRAEKFCITCDRSMCQEHSKDHESYNNKFGLTHRVVASETTAAARRRMCSLHNEELRGVCSGCQCVLCFKCLTDSKCTQAANRHHQVVDINELVGTYRGRMNDMLADICNRIVHVDELEREACSHLEEQKRRCDVMKQLVNQVLEEQYALMAEKTKRINLAIDAHYAGCQNQYKSYTETLSTHKMETQQIRRKINAVQRRGPYDIHLERTDLTERSRRLLSFEMNIFDLPSQQIHRYEQKVEIEKEVETPDQLKIKAEREKAEIVSIYNEADAQNEREKSVVKRLQATLKQKEIEKEELESRYKEATKKINQAEFELNMSNQRNEQLCEVEKQLKIKNRQSNPYQEEQQASTGLYPAIGAAYIERSPTAPEEHVREDERIIRNSKACNLL